MTTISIRQLPFMVDEPTFELLELSKKLWEKRKTTGRLVVVVGGKKFRIK